MPNSTASTQVPSEPVNSSSRGEPLHVNSPPAYPTALEDGREFDLRTEAATSSPDWPPPVDIVVANDPPIWRENPVLGPVGLSDAQISRKKCLEDLEDLEDTQCGIAKLYYEGQLLRIKTRKAVDRGRNNGGARGPITTFTRRSRRNLQRQFARMKCASADDWYFETLTFPGRWRGCYKTAKECLDRFAKRLEYRFPGTSFVWKMDIKNRRSGASEGEDIPHFHLLIYAPGVEGEALKRWIGGTPGKKRRKDGSLDTGAWQEITLSCDLADHLELTETERENHAAAATDDDFEDLRSWNGVQFYASEYLGHDVEIGRSRERERTQADEGSASALSAETVQDVYGYCPCKAQHELEAKITRPGKFWGIRARSNVPWSGSSTHYLTRSWTAWLLRVVQRSVGYRHRPDAAYYFTRGQRWGAAGPWARLLASRDPPTLTHPRGIGEMERRSEAEPLDWENARM